MHKRLTLLDQIVYAAILAESIWYFANLHYGKELELMGSLLCFVLHFCVFSIIYQIFLLLWDKWMKAEVVFIVSSIFTEQQPTCEVEMLSPSVEPSNSDIPRLDVEEALQASRVKEEEELNQNIELQFHFMNHFIGQSLDESQKGILKANLKAFATDDKPNLLPITTAKIENYGIYDILHLCHAIGHHTLRSKTIYEIAQFAKSCFPSNFANWEIETLARKLTYTEYNNISIRVYKKSEPLPSFS